LSSTASNSTQTSNASTVPPGKKWPTFRVRTTTSTRTDSPRRTATGILSSGASTGAGGTVDATRAAPNAPDSSPMANVLAILGPDAVRATSGADTAALVMPNRSTEICPSRRKSCTTFSCTESWLTNGTAVFAAGNRCDRTLPFFAAGSLESTSGMWQSVHLDGFAG
jgi:hypothetical protein